MRHRGVGEPDAVGVTLAPVRYEGRTGLLVVRRAIPPQIGKLALVGGFVEEHESWQAGAAREVREEATVLVDPARRFFAGRGADGPHDFRPI